MISPSNQFPMNQLLTTISTVTTLTLAYLLYKQNKQYNAGSIEKNSVYETKQSLYEYLLMHYGTRDELLPSYLLNDHTPSNAIDYPKQCALEVGRLVKQAQFAHLNNSILEIGCSVGRTSFELSRVFSHITALDYSHSFIDTANMLKQSGTYQYERRTEGILTVPCVARVDPVLNRNAVQFIQGDACNLNNPKLIELNRNRKYDVILGCNLLCRLPKPRRFLDNLHNLLQPNGLVVFMSPYSWLDQFTVRNEWIGGYIDDNGNELSCNGELIKEMKLRGFKLIEESDMPFFIRETARKSQWTIAHKTVFQMI